MPGKFNPGDLVYLNQYGFFITPRFDGSIGIIVSGPYSVLTPAPTVTDIFYKVYDILLDGELFKMVPEEFMESYGKNEKDTK